MPVLPRTGGAGGAGGVGDAGGGGGCVCICGGGASGGTKPAEWGDLALAAVTFAVLVDDKVVGW